MAVTAHPSPGDRGPAYGREDVARIRGAWAEGEAPSCPRCACALARTSVPPRSDVAYVRDRVLLVCPECRSSVAVERRHRKEGAAANTTPHPRPQVGWREWVTVTPTEGGPVSVKAKVDTGARTSALHAESLELFEREGEPWIRFTLLPHQRDNRGAVVVEAPRVDRRRVRSSSGEAQERHVVRLPLVMGGEAFEAEVTLARRDRMGFRMLLGRTALRGRFLVDPGRSYLQGPASAGDRPVPSPPSSPSPPRT